MTATFGQVVIYTMTDGDEPGYAGSPVPAIVSSTYDNPSASGRPADAALVHLTNLGTNEYGFPCGNLITNVAEGTGNGEYQVLA